MHIFQIPFWPSIPMQVTKQLKHFIFFRKVELLKGFVNRPKSISRNEMAAYYLSSVLLFKDAVGKRSVF